MDTDRASAFMTTNARFLDRRRFDLITGRGGPEAALSALAAYRNDDGGWDIDFMSYSAAGALEWRDYETVRVINR